VRTFWAGRKKRKKKRTFYIKLIRTMSVYFFKLKSLQKHIIESGVVQMFSIQQLTRGRKIKVMSAVTLMFFSSSAVMEAQTMTPLILRPKETSEPATVRKVRTKRLTNKSDEKEQSSTLVPMAFKPIQATSMTQVKIDEATVMARTLLREGKNITETVAGLYAGGFKDALIITSALGNCGHKSATVILGALKANAFTAIDLAIALRTLGVDHIENVVRLMKHVGMSAAEIGQSASRVVNVTATELAKALRGEGFSPENIANALGQFGLTSAIQVASVLKCAGMTAIDTVKALRAFGMTGAGEIAGLLKTVGFSAAQIGVALTNVLNVSLNQAAKLLKEIGFSAVDVTKGIVNIARAGADTIVAALSYAGFPVEEMGGALRSVGIVAINVVSKALQRIGATTEQIAKSLFRANYTPQAIASGLKQAGHTVKNVSKAIGSIGVTGANNVGKLLKGAGFGSKDIAHGLKELGHGANDIAKALKSCDYGWGTIVSALKDIGHTSLNVLKNAVKAAGIGVRDLAKLF
jgi:hypothetical protein